MAIMTSDADTVALLERALDQTAGLIAAMDASQSRVFCQPILVARAVGQQLSQDVIAYTARLL